jgi:glyoxylate reductase
LTTRAKILVAAPLVGDHVASLERDFDVETTDRGTGLTQDELAARVVDKDALLAVLTLRIDAALLGRAPSLRVVANHAVGVDNVDLDACRARNVVVTNTPGVLTEATADLAFGLVLDACRRISEGDRIVRAQGFPPWSTSFLLGRRVHRATLGIVGFGRIGQAVARRARGFEMRVLYASRSRAAPDVELTLGAEHRDLDTLLAESDIVSLHAPLDTTTRGLLSRDRILRMKKGAILVNTARGALVDERALAESLHAGHVAAAGLDVYAREPEIDPLLLTAPRVVLAPHIGSADHEARSAMARLACESIRDVLEGRTPKHRVA